MIAISILLGSWLAVLFGHPSERLNPGGEQGSWASLFTHPARQTGQQGGILWGRDLNTVFTNFELKHNWFCIFKIHPRKRSPSKNGLDLAKCSPFAFPQTHFVAQRIFYVHVSFHPQNFPLFKGKARPFFHSYALVSSPVLCQVGPQTSFRTKLGWKPYPIPQSVHLQGWHPWSLQ